MGNNEQTAQMIEIETPVGGITVDTGNDYLDFAFAFAFFVAGVGGVILLRYMGKRHG